MKLTPLNWILLGLLALLMVAHLTLRRGGPAEREVGKLFGELFADRAARLLIEGGEERLEARRSEPGVWILPDHFGHPARADRVAFLLQRLTSLTTLDLLSEDPASHDGYGVGEGGEALTVRVWDASDRLLAGLVQGLETTGEGARSTYVRVLGEDAVYRAPRLRRVPIDPRLWLDRDWLAFEPAVVTGVELSGSALEAPLSLTRDETTVDRWRRGDGELVAASRVKDFLAAARGLFFEEVLAARAADTEFGAVELSIELTLLDGSRLVGLFGGPAPGGESRGGVLACHDRGGWVVRFPQAVWENLLKEARRLGGG